MLKQCLLLFKLSSALEFWFIQINVYFIKYYFHDIRKEDCFLSRHHTCAGGVMVWGAISFYGTCEFQFVTSKMNANVYKTVRQKAFPEFCEIYGHIQ